VPPLHIVPAAHTFPQPPQFMLSDATVTQEEPHQTVSTGHEHAPLLHVVPAWQTTPQPPQWSRSLLVSMQTPAQSSWGASQWRCQGSPRPVTAVQVTLVPSSAAASNAAAATVPGRTTAPLARRRLGSRSCGSFATSILGRA